MISKAIRFPKEVLNPEDEYDPNDPGVDMSELLAEFNRQRPDYDRRVPNADERPS